MTEAVLFIIIVGGFIYFIPAFLAKDKKNARGIIVLNVFLGWTLIGWVAALVWAVSDEKAESISKHLNIDKFEKESLLKPMVDKGEMSIEEYDKIINKPEPSPESASNRFDQLKKLKELLDGNAITQAVYGIHKAKLLNRIRSAKAY